jgi:hypothetical protein
VGDNNQLKVGFCHNSLEAYPGPAYDHTSVYTWRSITDYHIGLSGMMPNAQYAPRLLKFTGRCPRFQVAHRELSNTIGDDLIRPFVRVAIGHNCSILCLLFWDIELPDVVVDGCLVILIGGHRSTHDVDDYTFSRELESGVLLVLKPLQMNGLYERVGLLSQGVMDCTYVEDTWQLPIYEECTVIIQ